LFYKKQLCLYKQIKQLPNYDKKNEFVDCCCFSEYNNCIGTSSRCKRASKKKNRKEVKAAKAQQKIVVDPQSEEAKAVTKGKSEAAKANAAAKKEQKKVAKKEAILR
jgi:hypothetical protein